MRNKVLLLVALLLILVSASLFQNCGKALEAGFLATVCTLALPLCFFLPNTGFLLSFGGKRNRACSAVHNRCNKITDIVHRVVVFLHGDVVALGGVPLVKHKLAT